MPYSNVTPTIGGTDTEVLQYLFTATKNRSTTYTHHSNSAYNVMDQGRQVNIINRNQAGTDTANLQRTKLPAEVAARNLGIILNAIPGSPAVAAVAATGVPGTPGYNPGSPAVEYVPAKFRVMVLHQSGYEMEITVAESQVQDRAQVALT